MTRTSYFLRTIRQFTSILLAIGFVLPLSTCTYHSDDGGKTMSLGSGAEYSVDRSGVQAIGEIGQLIASGKAVDGIGRIGLVVIIFFLPLLTLRWTSKFRSVLLIVVAPLAEYLLLSYVDLSTSLRFGGVLVLPCWPALFAVSLVDLRLGLRNRHRPATA
jgi:hypothetical protein